MEQGIEIKNLLLEMEKEGSAVCKLNFSYEFDIEILKTFKTAIGESFKIDAVYHNKTRILEPLGIIYGEKVYLAAYEKDKGDDIYIYDLSKFESYGITEEKFEKRDFNLKSYADEAFRIYHGEILNVKLFFNLQNKDKAYKYIFHPNQKIETKENGVILSFSAGGNIEIMRQIFKLGKDCKILEPETLINDYKKYLKEIISLYDEN